MESTFAADQRRDSGTGHRFSAACAMPAADPSVPALRRLAVCAGRRWGLAEDVVEALSLIVSELVTNAVRHSGGSEVTLLLCVTDTALTVQVQDSGAWRPRPVPPEGGGAGGGPVDGMSCGGRGLLLVEAYAVGCEVRTSDRGTTVTAELACRPSVGRARAEAGLPLTVA